MDDNVSSLNASAEFDNQKTEAAPPPPYQQSALSPLLLAETTTTRTEVVTTTTTETTTHLFSLPSWRKRNGHRSPSPPRHSTYNELSHTLRSSCTLVFDKALPPTPPNESRDDDPGLIHENTNSHSFSASSCRPELSRSRKASTGPQSTAALARATLGIGLPHASATFSNFEVNSVAFMPSPSPLSSISVASPSVRRVKSSQRVQTRHASEDHEGDQVVERRRRGLSFGAASFLSVGIPDIKGKGKDTEPTSTPSKPSPKPLSRKSSFWAKKKGPQPSEAMASPPSQNDTVLTLSPLPSVHHVSPFNISDFTISSSATDTSNLPFTPRISRSHSDKSRLHRPSHLSSDIPTTSSPQRLGHSQMTPSCERIAQSQSNGEAPVLPRLRTQASSPLLHRLSLGVFSYTESSPAPSILSNNQCQSPQHSGLLSSFSRKADMVIPKRLGEEESPEIYLTRLKSAVSKAEIAGILASSSDPFYAQALRAYINQFEFLDIPLDVALRKLLMEVGLPSETQQIDRVMEAFAFRYMQCNPNLFTSEDHPYILAFSLIMLHTDVFNPSNKHKMNKADYIKNTKLPGIPVEVLDCFFDNIVFAPFIFVEDPVDFNGQPGLTPDVARSMTINTPTSIASNSNVSPLFKLGNKVDPYYLISNNLLEPLTVGVESYLPIENPFSYEGTDGPWDEPDLHRAFVQASVIEVDAPAFKRAAPMFNLSPTGTPGSLLTNGDEVAHPSPKKVETWSLKITKVGLLNRKDDLVEGGKRSFSRKWKPWSVVLTGSQLLFFRDPVWASALLPPSDSSPRQASVFRPDELFSVKDAIAVYDRSYNKKQYNHTLRFVLPNGRQLLLQAANEKDLNEWISRINYASAFKTAGVRMRPLGLSGEDVHLTGVAAATSHLHDMQEHDNAHRPRSWGSNAPNDLMNMLSGEPSNRPTLQPRVTVSGGRSDFDLDVPVAPEIDGAEQFKATFDQVKADLAARYWPAPDEEASVPQEESQTQDSPPASPSSFDSKNSRLPSRSQILQSKIRELDSKIAGFQSQLDSDGRCVRNIAILTPFQKSTRLRLLAAIQGMSRRVMQVRLDMEKLKCHRAVLRCDLSSEGRSWNQSKRVALRAAKETLQSRRAHTIPKMTLSLLDDHAASSTEDLSHMLKTPLYQRAGSSTCGSFHSATDMGLDWPSSEDITFLTTSQKCDSPRTNFSTSSSSFPFSTAELERSAQTRQKTLSTSNSNDQSLDENGKAAFAPHENDNISQDEDDEEAEEWNKTRCAQRVSLIHVPSDIRISTRLKGATDP